MSGSRKDPRPDFARLRHRAEALSRRLGDKRSLSGLTIGEIQRLVHNLDVHRIELEMQNDELRHTQAALEAARDRYSGLFDMAPVGYFSLDPKGAILEVNLTGATLLRTDRRLLAQKKLRDFVARNDQDSFFTRLRRNFKNPVRERYELEMERADGFKFFAELEGVAQREDSGRINQCLTVISDITDRRHAQAMCQEAREAAERANAAKTRFLAAASHDLRQPLQALATFNEVLKITLDGGDAVELIHRQAKCLNNMRDLLNALLDLSRLESGKIEPKVRSFQIGSLLEQIETEQRALATSKGLALRVVGRTVAVHSDPTLLGQILSNLVNNAIRYTESGTVLVGCRRRGETLRIEVRDTGIGIPDSKRALIFEEFYQLDNPAREPHKGLGLGLAIVQRTARLLAHDIEVRSTDKGTVFTVVVPLAGPDAVGDAYMQPPSIPRRSALGATLLVVDDDPAVLQAITSLLHQYGYRVIAARDGPEALAKVVGGSLFRPTPS